ncbi:O-antigen acetylase domain protein fragment [Streptococcus troglodytae]|uniref:O-antigen acetylase domain protein n=1 Tax=Streptococcus troglodytae TaxID=1111760 RepID=A0A1L7LHV0_9STRE|nr:hypothetical protein [Streptococcus troglodytae]BAQ23698.1 O-antigen acetylase domain protein fragment [Streptococcus troglodytae]
MLFFDKKLLMAVRLASIIISQYTVYAFSNHNLKEKLEAALSKKQVSSILLDLFGNLFHL